MDDDTHVVWGLIRRRAAILAITLDEGGFTVAVTPDEAAFVAAADIVRLERLERRVLRVEHTVPGLPCPVELILKRRHPVRLAIEGLRPDLVTGPLPSPWWWVFG